MALAPKDSTINKPHVLHVASGDLWAGAEVMLFTLAKSLHKDFDVKTTVILLNPGTLEQKLRECGITVQVIDESQFNGLQIFQQLNNVIKQTRPDVIHTHRIKENILGSIVAWRNGIPSIRTTHGAPEHRPPFYKIPKQLILLTDRLSGRYCQENIVAVSPDLADKLKHHFPNRKIKVIENGIDIASLVQDQPIRHPNNTDSYKIGIAGRLVPIKRVDLFIESAIYLKQHHPELNIDFQIYGNGPLHDALKTQIQSRQASNYIKLAGHCEKIREELQTLDALLMTSDHEGLPMILLEAMSLQVPIIAHAVGGIPNLLDNGQCGVLVNDQTAEAFAQAIVNLTKQPEEHRSLATRAFTRVKNNYSAQHTANAYLNLYKEIIPE